MSKMDKINRPNIIQTKNNSLLNIEFISNIANNINKLQLNSTLQIQIQIQYFHSVLYQFSEDTLMKLNTFFDTLEMYMIRGILEDNIAEDGGFACYQEIPFFHHTAFIIVLSIIFLVFFFKWKHHLTYRVKEQLPSTFQKVMALFALISWILTFYFKLKTWKGLFMFNPCHIVIMIEIYLLISKNTKRNITIYSAWSGWLFGPYMALLVPHLNGISQFEVFLYYFEHLAIVPCGYLVLNKRYGFLKPNIKNQMPAFATIAFWQIWVLAPLGRNTMVNLNYALCHSPADPTYSVFGYYYFVVCALGLNVFSYLSRWISYLQIKVFYNILSNFGIKSPQINPRSYESIETPEGQQF